MSELLILAIAAVLTPVALYLVAPARLLALLRWALRLRSGSRVRWVEAAGSRWPYLEGGNPAGEPMVLLHGYAGDKDNWALYLPHFRRRYRLICPDLPGFGENDRSLGRDYAGARQAERLVQFLDALGIDHCHLAGNSMGGLIALHTALAYPGRLRSLTLIDSAGVAGARQSELMAAAARGENGLAVRSEADFDRVTRMVMHKPPSMPRRFKRVMIDDALRHQASLDEIFAKIVEDISAHPLNSRLHEIRVPTLVIWGREDRAIDVSCVAVLEQGIAGSEAGVLEETGHVPMVERPGETARHHLDFLRRHAAGGQPVTATPAGSTAPEAVPCG
jgi:pimeloyl-ACP methyl ester carboxylesterase